MLAVFMANLGSYPLDNEARRAADRKRVSDVAMKAFQEGRYLEACEVYRRALPDLKYKVYASERAAESLLYCGDRKSAVKAAVGYDITPFWPSLWIPRFWPGYGSRAEGTPRPSSSFGDGQASCCTRRSLNRDGERRRKASWKAWRPTRGWHTSSSSFDTTTGRARLEKPLESSARRCASTGPQFPGGLPVLSKAACSAEVRRDLGRIRVSNLPSERSLAFAPS
jgi:hypothetical protein